MDDATMISRISQIRFAGWVGLIVNLVLAAAKLAAGLIGHSQAVVADAIHSLSDTVTDVALILGVRYWSAPADEAPSSRSPPLRNPDHGLHRSHGGRRRRRHRLGRRHLLRTSRHTPPRSSLWPRRCSPSASRKCSTAGPTDGREDRFARPGRQRLAPPHRRPLVGPGRHRRFASP